MDTDLSHRYCVVYNNNQHKFFHTFAEASSSIDQYGGQMYKAQNSELDTVMDYYVIDKDGKRQSFKSFAEALIEIEQHGGYIYISQKIEEEKAVDRCFIFDGFYCGYGVR